MQEGGRKCPWGARMGYSGVEVYTIVERFYSEFTVIGRPKMAGEWRHKSGQGGRRVRESYGGCFRTPVSAMPHHSERPSTLTRFGAWHLVRGQESSDGEAVECGVA